MQVNNKKRYNVYLNDIYAFSVHEDILVSFQLYKGKEIDEESLREVLQQEEINKAWHKALKYLNYRARTTKEVKQYLSKEEYEQEVINLVIEKLYKKNFLNDNLYAKEFIEQRVKSKPRGKMLIELELKNKGISSKDIRENMENVDEAIEYNMAFQLTEKKYKRYKGLDWQGFQRKMGNYLLGKGFPHSIVTKVLQRYKDSL